MQHDSLMSMLLSFCILTKLEKKADVHDVTVRHSAPAYHTFPYAVM